MRTRTLAGLVTALMLALVSTTGCAEVLRNEKTRNIVPVPYDVRELIRPKKKFFGMAVNDVQESKVIEKFSRDAGRRPNLVAFYVSFLDKLDVEYVTKIWEGGAVPLVVWEPMRMSVADIASGKYDGVLRDWAETIRALPMPIVINWSHEFNGDWYPWGLCVKRRPQSVACKTGYKTTAADWLNSYKRVHDQFMFYGATNSIWLWSPNINDGRGVDLEDYWPGQKYVDWVGPIGYFEWSGPGSAMRFGDLFGPTIKQIRKFSNKPVLIPETGAPPGPNKAAEIGDLWYSVATRKDVIGAIWFHIKKEKDWRFTTDPGAHAAFKDAAKNPVLRLDPADP